MWAIRVLFVAAFAAFLCPAELAPIPSLPDPKSSLQILARTQTSQPWTVAGERGALFGRQNGKFEAWLWPVKLLSNFSIQAELSDYPVPIDVNALSAEIQVTPAETVITYSHAAFTVRQRMFARRGEDLVKPCGFGRFRNRLSETAQAFLLIYTRHAPDVARSESWSSEWRMDRSRRFWHVRPPYGRSNVFGHCSYAAE